MHDNHLPDHSCRLRRKSTASPFAIPTNDLQSASDIRRELRHSARSQSAFGEHHEQLSAIAALQLRLAELAPGPEQALDLIAQEALTVTNAYGTAIALALGQAVVCCARAGSLGPPLGAPLDTRSGLSGECLRSGEVVCCDDAETDARVDVNACRQSGIRSALAVPLRRHEQVIGVIAVFSHRLAAFGYWEARLLQLLADLSSEPRILDGAPGNLSDLELCLPAAAPCVVGILPAQKSTVERESPPAAANASTLDSESHTRVSSWEPGGPARSRQISKCLDRIRQDPGLRLLGRAKAYLTIEDLHDGSDRSHAIALCQELMFQRVAEIGVAANSTTS